MHCRFVISFLILTIVCTNAFEKINLETLNNYSEFLNFGQKKLHKVRKENLQNDIIKSKIDVLGEIFKYNIDALKISGKLDLVFLIDASSSVGEINFNSELKFVKKLLSDVTVDFNHTRVAIVTYSSSVHKNIDEITVPRKENNKCLLLNRQLNSIEYTGGGTNTLGAFQTAQDIFQNSRNDSKKALVLITDGFSNGGDPVPLANQLKNEQITIFTIGIQNGNYRELYEIASTPGELYSYLLDSFQEFESLARRALHVDLKSGEYIPLGISSPCDSLCEAGNCCDKNALCTCGTSTGHYSCVCKLGYYGSGTRDSCIPCPSGTYSNGPNLCLPCPDMHHVTEVPALSIASCKCKIGYQPTKNNECEIVKCPKIKAPEFGYFVKKSCGHVLNSACGIRCEVGYTLVGSSIRLCQADGTWSGEEPSCQIKTCTSLSPPPYGSINCSHSDLAIVYNSTNEYLPVDTTCTFACQDGKTLIGSNQRTCLPLARWDGLKTFCKQIKCQRLVPVKNGRIEPKFCTLSKQTFGEKCRIVCNDGFELIGPSERTCVSHGMWDSNFDSTVCKDVTVPMITCPGNITGSTLPGTNYGTVTWEKPVVVDNSEVNVWTKPSIKNVTAFKFQMGSTQVTYFAQDPFGNRAKCIFFVTILDLEPPAIEDCSSPPIFLTNDKKGANITWDEPNIFDNAGSVEVNKTHNFGSFPVGTTAVLYTAVDSYGNVNQCTLNITIEEAHCEALPDPIFGHSECSSSTDLKQCVITCQEGYAVPLAQPQENSSISFMCNDSESVWYNQQGLMFPECSITEIPKNVEQNGSLTVHSDLENCNSTKELQELENDIKTGLQEKTCDGNCTIETKTECEDEDLPKEDENEEQTNIIKREVAYEEVHLKKKGKRKRISVKFQVKGYQKNRTSDETEIINLGSYQNLKVKYSQPKITCLEGYVPRRNRCVQCPRGTFHNITKNRCQSCPYDFYNDIPAQTSCKICPIHHSTRKLNCKKIEDCKEQCPPGTYARKKILVPNKKFPGVKLERSTLKPHCRSCPLGYYQPYFNSLKCLKCPKDYITMSPKSVSASQCVLTMRETCTKTPNVCNSGRCVSINDYQYSCECPEGYIGTNCERKLSMCDSNPCINGGICGTSSNNIICTCPRGFKGRFCEVFEEKCLLKCLNQGTCFQNDVNDYICLCPEGFGGDSCEIRLSYCENHVCENNSTCIEGPGSYKCLCPEGYMGRRCNILPCDYKPCKGNNICVNTIEKNATRNSYTCVCPQGFTGELCDIKIDFCANLPCLNGGTCVGTTSGYLCKCSKIFWGLHCEYRRRSDYILNFHKFSTHDYVKLDGFPGNLTEITACLWMQTRDNFNYGTILSYATNQYDNAFTLTDYTGLVLYINNHYVVTDILLNDGGWHHICVTWENTQGSYSIYIDEKLSKTGTGLATSTQIVGNGNMVIGQEQDILGGRFSQSESFIGKMAYLDVWSEALKPHAISRHINDCDPFFYGDIYAWPELLTHVHGNILIENSSFCMQCEEPKPLYNGVINIEENKAYYSCYEGFLLSSAKFSEGRRCTKAAKWEGVYEPYCKKIYCGHPGFLRNGYVLGTKYYYLDKITYRCYDSYNLIGNSTALCTENGVWYPEKPLCKGLQCKMFPVPHFGNITVLSEETYQEIKSEYDVGTQIEISCLGKTKLKGENVVTCQEDGTWDVDAPVCEFFGNHLGCAIDKVPSAPANGFVVMESLYAAGNGTSDTVEYHCRNGYNITGDNFTKCIIDGYWTEPNISCNAITCEPPEIHHMVVVEGEEKELYLFGNMLKYDCGPGYRLFGDGTIRCTSSGGWSKMRATCSKNSCSKPHLNESTQVSGRSFLFQDEVLITCPSGNVYNLTCDSTGEWLGEIDDTC